MSDMLLLKMTSNLLCAVARTIRSIITVSRSHDVASCTGMSRIFLYNYGDMSNSYSRIHL